MAAVAPNANADSVISAKATGTRFGNDAVGKVMAKYDKDGSGSFDVSEVRSIVQDVQEQMKLNKQLKKMVGVLVVFVLLLLGCLTATAIVGAMVGGEAIKEAKVPDCADPSVASG